MCTNTELKEKIALYAECKRQIAFYERLKKQAGSEILSELKARQIDRFDGAKHVIRINESVDRVALKTQYPDIYESVKKESITEYITVS